jgi:porin
VREDDQLDVANAVPARKRRQHGGYLLGERTVLHFDEDRFLSLFGRYSWADGDSSSLKSTTSLGVHVKGPFASRPDDIIGLAWSRAETSSRWRAAQSVGGTATEHAETGVELTYKYNVTPWFAIQPNLQRISNPGGLSGIPAARIIGARFEFVL